MGDRQHNCIIPGFRQQSTAGIQTVDIFDLLRVCHRIKDIDLTAELNGGKPTRPDWPDIFTSSLHLADIFNQAVYSKFDYLCVPPEFRMIIPSDSIKDAWIEE